MRQYTKGSPGSYELKIVTAPDGRPGALVQFEDGYVIFNDPEELREFAAETAVLWWELRRAIAEAQ